MSRNDQILSETDIRSEAAETFIIRADAGDSRAWIKNSPACQELHQYRIRHLAVAHMPAPFEIVRTNLGGSYFLACFGGEGRVLVDGRWTKCLPEQAVLLPPGTLHAFHTPPNRSWDFCWVRYQERSGQQPLTAAQAPVIARFDSEGLRLAILGLFHECDSKRGSASTSPVSAGTDRDPVAIRHWIELIQHYVSSFAAPKRLDPRLWQLWERVALRLAEPWTIAEMAQSIHLSEKQLQRLCLKELGRSPKQQLIWLRMRRAAELLVKENDSVEAVAQQVGYQNPFVFSTTFKRVMGWPPSQYPGRR